MYIIMQYLSTLSVSFYNEIAGLFVTIFRMELLSLKERRFVQGFPRLEDGSHAHV